MEVSILQSPYFPSSGLDEPMVVIKSFRRLWSFLPPGVLTISDISSVDDSGVGVNNPGDNMNLATGVFSLSKLFAGDSSGVNNPGDKMNFAGIALDSSWMLENPDWSSNLGDKVNFSIGSGCFEDSKLVFGVGQNILGDK